MINPLITGSELPSFSQIKPEHIEPAIRTILADNRRQLKALLEDLGQPSWHNFVQPMDDMKDRLDQTWSTVQHMNAVVSSPALRVAYKTCLSLLSEYATELGQNNEVYLAYRTLAESDVYSTLSATQRKVIDNTLRDFTLAGINLSEEGRKRYGEIKQQLSAHTNQFSANLLDAAQAWTKLISDKAKLSGVPETALSSMRQAAQVKEQTGYLLELTAPSYLPIMAFCDNRALREEVYEAFITRASELGPHAGEWDNSELIQRILALRHELALLLGFKNYAEVSLATKMANSSQQILDFFTQILEHALPVAKKEFTALQYFAEEVFQVSNLNPWDIAYYSEKQRLHNYAISQETLRPYLPVDQVLQGMFEVVKRLYGIDITLADGISVWHKDVRCFDICRDGERIACFYLDLYARENKRGNAWFDECRVHRRLANGQLQRPAAYLTCNFMGPVGNNPALLTHADVLTLFHEFGHGLHHMLTRVEEAGISGLRGVAWDVVEMPSGFMENWCWQPEVIALISKNYQTEEALPLEQVNNLLAAKNFQSGMETVRQLEYGLFDFLIHQDYSLGASVDVQGILDEVRERVAVVPFAPYNRFQHGFNHIFGGGFSNTYAAGFYSYNWAEIFSSDAFTQFENEGLFNRETGEAFFARNIEPRG